jgi:hypothetical protein
MKTKIFLLAAALVLGAVLAGCSTPAPSTVYLEPQAAPRTITVTGTGMVTVTPDIAYVDIGVQTQEASAATAMDENNTEAAQIIAAIKNLGVADKDIQTTDFSITPQPQYDSNNKLTGIQYQVDDTVQVTVRDLNSLGTLLDTSVQDGANNISNISFDLADKTTAMTQARQAAVADARQQADELIAATGVQLGAVQSITYSDVTPTPVTYELAAPMAAASNSVPVQSGSLQISTTVTIVYAIK